MNNEEPPRGSLARHPIQVVARRTGLTADVIRAWERRHRAVVPGRTDTGRRLYSDADAERLLLLKRSTEHGRRIGDVAALGTPALREMVAADLAARHANQTTTMRPRRSADAHHHAEAAMTAIRDYDAGGIRRALHEAHVCLGLLRTLEEVVSPLLGRVGDGWRDASLRVAHEHLASAEVRSYLGSVLGSCANDGEGPCAVVATPVGQMHELGALMCALVAANAGWRALYMGPNLPSDAIAAAARDTGASAIVLSICYPADDDRLDEELRRLGAQVASTMPLIAGGEASGAYRDALANAGAERVDSLLDLHAALDDLRRRD